MNTEDKTMKDTQVKDDLATLSTLFGWPIKLGRYGKVTFTSEQIRQIVELLTKPRDYVDGDGYGHIVPLVDSSGVATGLSKRRRH